MRGNGSALAYRQEVAREMSTSQIAEAQKAAREWLATQWSGRDRQTAH